ncbi:MAG: ATP-binding protein [Blastocatellia bacterium AA13]|nr:MAG: ATP-binding protein [Blastocatellia bacterium AA13]
MSETIELSIESKYEFVDMVASISRDAAGRIGFDEDTSGWIELAVREALINAIKHGNKGDEGKPVDVRFVIEKEALSVYVRDRGEGFDHALLPDPLDPGNLLNPTGRGIFFMRTFMDEVEYLSHPEGGSVVRMYKGKHAS